MAEIAAWLDQHNVSLLTIGVTVGVLSAASIIILVLSRLVRRRLRYLEARLHLPYETALLVTRVITGALWFITAVIVLDLWGVGFGGLWAVLVSAMTVIGVGFLATWTMISNITASLFLAIWRPFHFGQTVEILPENLQGRVISRNLMFTLLREESGSLLQIPNNFFFQKTFRVSGEVASSAFDSLDNGDSASVTPEMDSAPRAQTRIHNA